MGDPFPRISFNFILRIVSSSHLPSGSKPVLSTVCLVFNLRLFTFLSLKSHHDPRFQLEIFPSIERCSISLYNATCHDRYVPSKVFPSIHFFKRNFRLIFTSQSISLSFLKSNCKLIQRKS